LVVSHSRSPACSELHGELGPGALTGHPQGHKSWIAPQSIIPKPLQRNRS
jgi:hypothetical protein